MAGNNIHEVVDKVHREGALCRSGAAVPAGGMPIPDWNSPTYAEDMQTYYAAMQGIMTASADDSFVPGLDCLDQYIQSLNIGD